MSTTQFNLTTHWPIAAPLDAVWQAISTPEEWPSWWPAVIDVRLLEQGDAVGVGAYRRMMWRTALPYRLSFNMRTTVIERCRRIEGIADGNLEGRGCWQFSAEGEFTHLRYDWQVVVAKPWMRLFAPLLRPMFCWNHGVVMEWGRRGIHRHLNAPPLMQPTR